MIKKEDIIKVLHELPDEIALEELIDKLLFIQKVENGLFQSESGKTLTEEEARQQQIIVVR